MARARELRKRARKIELERYVELEEKNESERALKR